MSRMNQLMTMLAVVKGDIHRLDTWLRRNQDMTASQVLNSHEHGELLQDWSRIEKVLDEICNEGYPE
jgi:hypothetical protein